MDRIKTGSSPEGYFGYNPSAGQNISKQVPYAVFAGAALGFLASRGRCGKMVFQFVRNGLFKREVPKVCAIAMGSFSASQAFTDSIRPIDTKSTEYSKLRSQVTERIVGHEAEFLITGTDLEGGLVTKHAAHLQTFTEVCEERKAISVETGKRLKSFFDNFVYFPSGVYSQASFPRELARKLRELEPGKPLPLEGRLRHKGVSHALIYLFTKRPDGLFDIYIYNTGYGVETYHDQLTVEDGILRKMLICPYVKYQGVGPAELGITGDNPEFFGRLIQLGLRKGKEKDPAKFIYASRDGFGAFNDKRTLPGPNTSYIEPQRAGTCSWNVLLSSMKNLFENEEEFERYNFELQYTDYVLFFEDSYKLTPIGEWISYGLGSIFKKPIIREFSPISVPKDLATQQLLIGQGERLLRILEERRDLFPSEEILKMRTKIESILDYMEGTLEPAVFKPVRSISAYMDVEPKELLDRGCLEPRVERKAIDIIRDKEILTEETTFQNMDTHLDKILTRMQSCRDLHDPVSVYATEKMVQELLKIHPNDWASLSSLQAANLLRKLYKVCEKYISIPIEIRQARSNTLWAFVEVARSLTIQVIPSLVGYKIAHKGLLAMQAEEISMEYSRKCYEERENLLNDLRKPMGGIKIFDYDTYRRMCERDDIPSEVDWLASILEYGPVSTWREAVSFLIEDISFLELRYGVKKGERWESACQLRNMVLWATLTNPLNVVYDPIRTEERTHRFLEPDDMKPVENYFMFDNSLNWIQEREIQVLAYSRDAWLKIWGFHPVYNKLESTFQKENDVLVGCQKRHIRDPIPHSAANQSLRCSKLIYLIKNDLTQMKDPEKQKIFFRLLFQMTKSGIPPIFLAAQDPAFIKQLTECIHSGIRFFTAHSDVRTALFFVRLSRRVQDAAPSVSLPSFRDQFNLWLKDPRFSQQERTLVHLHRILQYSNVNPKDLTAVQLQEIFQSWIHCRGALFTEIGDGAYQKEEASRLVLALTSRVESLSSQDLDRIVSEDFEEGLSQGSWTCSSFPTYTKGDYCVNVLRGEVFYKGRPREVDSYANLAEGALYQKIFGPNNPRKLIKEGGAYRFVDEVSGHNFWQFFQNKQEHIGLLYNGSWYDQYEVDSREVNVFPTFLITDCRCFAKGQERVFLDKRTREVVYIADANGNLINPSSGSRAAYADQFLFPLLEGFEERNWRLHEVDEKKNVKIRFPRFKTAAGNEFCLIQKGKDLVLEENPNLISVSPPNDQFPNALYFKHALTGVIECLIPVKGIDKGTGILHEPSLAPKHFLEIEDKDVDFRALPMQNGTFHFVEYIYSQGEMIPKNREASAFLSYLFLMQKKEKKSFALLEQLGRERALTDAEKMQLEWIVLAPYNSPNRTPSAIAIALKANLMLSRLGINVESVANDLVNEYRQAYSDIPAHLRLSSREMQELGILQNTDQKKTFPAHIPTREWGIEDRDIYEISFKFSDFMTIYNKLYNASSKEEKKDLISGVYLSSFPKTLRTILLIAAEMTKRESLPSPVFLPKPERKYDRIWEHDEKISNWIQQFRNHRFPKIYSLPKSEGQMATDALLAKGTPLYSLVDVEKQVRTGEAIQDAVIPKVEMPDIDLTERFFRPYFKEVRKEKSKNVGSLEIPSFIVGGQSPLYAGPCEKAVKEANLEIVLGQELNAAEATFYLENPDALSRLQEELKGTLAELAAKLSLAKEEILILAKLLPVDRLKAERTAILQRGKFLLEPEFEQLITHYLKGKYADINPNLSKEQLEDLDLRIQDFLVHAVIAQQIERALKENDSNLMGQILSAKMAYTPTQDKIDRALLVYEYRADMRVREVQVEAIKSLAGAQDVVQQLIMGGGKTTVLTSILLQLIEPGKIPFFVVPEAQFETQVENLGNMQRRYYYKEIVPMWLTRRDLTVEKLKWVADKFAGAKDYGDTIIVTPSTLPALQLEWLSLLDEKNPSTESEEKIALLTTILRDMRTSGVALIDEVDQILNIFTELNYTLGNKEPIKGAYIDFIEKVFSLHLNPDIEASLGLLRNTQSSYSIAEYKEKVLPFIADCLFEEYKDSFELENSWKESFKEYVLTGKANDLFTYLTRQVREGSPEQAQAAQFVFLAKGLLVHILPNLMEKAENKDYGLAEDGSLRKVIPYLGVDSPSSREFAGVYERACYHFLTALNSPITFNQLEQLADRYGGAVMQLLEHADVKWEDTEEYKKFFSLTGASLEKVFYKDKEAVDLAVHRLEEHPEFRLALEKEFIKEHVGTYAECYRSNAQNFCDLISSKKGLTGTPWNALTFADELASNLRLEPGTEGRIRSQILQKADQGTSRVRRFKLELQHCSKKKNS